MAALQREKTQDHRKNSHSRNERVGSSRCYKYPAMTKQDAARGIDILAKTVYRDLKQAGYSRADIVSFASNLLGHLTKEAAQPAAAIETALADATVQAG